MHLSGFLMGWGHSSFSIIYVGRGATSDEQFSFFREEKPSFRGPGFGYQFGSRFGPRGVQNEGRFRDQDMDPEIHG